MIDAGLLTARDFISVRAALVAAVGPAEALLITRIYWRTDPESRAAHEDMAGELWWRASYETLAEETGLTRDQVKRAMKVLVDEGHLDALQHKLNGNYDRTFSYRVNTDRAESPHPSGTPLSDRAESPDEDRAESPDAPIETLKTSQQGSSRGTRLPDGWMPTAEDVAWAKGKFPNVTSEQLSLEHEKFSNYWQAKSGRDATKLDWGKTWRNWMLTARDLGGRPAGGSVSRIGGKIPNSQRTADAAANWAATRLAHKEISR